MNKDSKKKNQEEEKEQNRLMTTDEQMKEEICRENRSFVLGEFSSVVVDDLTLCVIELNLLIEETCLSK